MRSRRSGAASRGLIAILAVGALALSVWLLRREPAPDGAPPAAPPTDPAGEAPAAAAVSRPGPGDAGRVEIVRAPDETGAQDPDAVPKEEAWRRARLAEIDRQLGILREDADPSQRQMNLQYVLLASISPIADEMGLSAPRATDGVARRVERGPHEHDFVSNNRDYRIPKGLFPVFDDFMSTWAEREARLAELPPEEAVRGLPEPFPLDPSVLADLERLAERAKDAIRRRGQPY